MSSCKGPIGCVRAGTVGKQVMSQICADAQNCAVRYSAGSCSSSRKYAVILSICSQLQRFLPNKMFRTNEILLVTTFLCFPGVISATCPPQKYSNLEDTLQSPGNSTGNYPPNQNCTYDVRVPAGKRIILAFDFKRFDVVGSMPDCPQDSLEIIVG